MKLLNTLLIILLYVSCSTPQVQKPRVAVVVWDENAKEGQNLGEIRVYQLGEPVSGLIVKIKYEGTASEGIDYRCYENVLKVDKYQKIVVRPILDGIVEGPEDVTIRILRSDD